MTGDSTTLVSSTTDKAWNLISRDTDILLNSILLRRSSYGSMYMRVWHTISAATWLDNKTIMNLTLGTFTADKRSSATMPSYEYIAIKPDVSTCPSTASPSPSGLQHIGDNGSSIGGKMRMRRSDGADSNKVEIAQHSRPIQCTWNSLAMLLFYKWHVRKEPLPDFRTDAWKNTPLFGTMVDSSMYDEYLARFCTEQYEEYVEAVKGKPQRHKRAHRSTFRILKAIIDTNMSVKCNVAAAKSVTVGRRIFGQPGILSEIHGANADVYKQSFDPRRTHSRIEYSTAGIEASIFPFVDDNATFSNYQGDPQNEHDWRDSLNAFCRFIKLLRRTLVQDMSLLFELQFYRRMMRGNPVLSSDIFQSFRFIENAKKVVNSSWRAEIPSMVTHMPKDTILTRIVPESLMPPPRPSTTATPRNLGIRRSSSHTNTKRTHSEADGSPVSVLSKRKQIRRRLPDTDEDSEIMVYSPQKPSDCEIIDLDLIESDLEPHAVVHNPPRPVEANVHNASASNASAKPPVSQNEVPENNKSTELQSHELNMSTPVNGHANETSLSTSPYHSGMTPTVDSEKDSDAEMTDNVRMDLDVVAPASGTNIDTSAVSVDTNLLLGGSDNQDYSVVDNIPLFAESIGNDDLSNWVNLMLLSMNSNNADNTENAVSAEPSVGNVNNSTAIDIPHVGASSLADQFSNINSESKKRLDDKESLARGLLDRIHERCNSIMQIASIAQSTDPSVDIELLSLKSDIDTLRQEFKNYVALHESYIAALKLVQESSSDIIDDKYNDLSDTPHSHRSSTTAVDTRGGSTDTLEL
ncbi:hypothetical protein GGI05_002579 [Coemansia sp. RSA 2603]|nr:hypothetical protein GGI05_002579 [Coemansia sp. RSA 2603]